MKTLRFNNLTLRNFRGHKWSVISPQGNDTTIAGRNGTGKTSFADAWFWAWTGKNSLHQADFDLKIRYMSGHVIHNLEYAVDLDFVFDGEMSSLSRILEEKWETTRGFKAAEFHGHRTKFKINSVPSNETEFVRWMSSICDGTVFRRLSDPMFVLSESWRERRKLLLEVCGDLTDAEVIAATPELSELPKILGSHTLEAYKKILAARKEEVRDGLKEIPARLDELDRLITEATTAKASKVDRAGLQANVGELQNQKARIQSGGQVAEFRKRLSILQGEEIDRQNIAQRNTNVQAIQADEEANRLKGQANELELQRDTLVAQITADRQAVETLESRLVQLRADKNTCSERTFNSTVKDQCPTCFQPLPEAEVAAKIEEARAQFNADQAAKLTAIREEGLAKSAKKNEILERITAKEQKIAEIETLIATLSDQIQSHRTTAEEIRAGSVKTEDKELTRILTEMERVKCDIAVLEKDAEGMLKAVDVEINELNEQLRVADQIDARLQEAERNKTRQEELGKQQKLLSEELEKIERESFLCEQFVAAKVRLLDTKINSRFKFARFTLSEVQINGGIKECCDCTYLGLPPSHGETIKLGLDIINVLAQHYGLALPIFIDNAEAVTDLPETIGQQIRLYVADSDLTVTYDAAAGAA